MTSDRQEPSASVPLAEPGRVDDPHLLGLDPGLSGHSGAVLQCRQSGGQEVDGDEAGEHWNRSVAFQVKNFFLNASLLKGTRQKKNVENSTLGSDPPPYDWKCWKFSKKKLKKVLKTFKSPK